MAYYSTLVNSLIIGIIIYYVPTKLAELFFFGRYGQKYISKPTLLLLVNHLLKLLAWGVIFAILWAYFDITTINWGVLFLSFMASTFISSFWNLIIKQKVT